MKSEQIQSILIYHHAAWELLETIDSVEAEIHYTRYELARFYFERSCGQIDRFPPLRLVA